MPTFLLKKLVRDKFRAVYADMNQTITTRKLSKQELRKQLRNKLLEEAKEVPVQGEQEDIVDELADIQQIVDDIRKEFGISAQQVDEAKQKKLAKKGGFREGLFVETITLHDDDEWVKYYRKEPEKYKEIDD